MTAFLPPFLADGGALVWIVVLVIYGIVQLVKKLGEMAERRKEEAARRERELRSQTHYQMPAEPAAPPPPPPRQPSSEEEEIRKFLEALGLPTDSGPVHVPVPVEEPRPAPAPPPAPRQTYAPPPLPPAPVYREEEEEQPYGTASRRLESLVGNESQSTFVTNIEQSHRFDSLLHEASSFMESSGSASSASDQTASLPGLFKDHNDLRRAIILREVLGTPKGLEGFKA